MSKYLELKNLDIKNITISELKKINKGYISYVGYNNSHFRLKFPRMETPFGITKFNKEDKSNYELCLSIDGNKSKELKDFFLNLDKFIFDYVKNNKKMLKILLKEGEDINSLNDKYHSIVKPYQYYDTIKTKIGYDYKLNMFKIKLYNNYKKEMELTKDNIETLLPKFCELKGVLQISYIWFIDNKFGVTIKVLQGRPYYQKKIEEIEIIYDSD